MSVIEKGKLPWDSTVFVLQVKMLSLCRFGVIPVLQTGLGARGFAKAVTQKSIYDTLNQNHVILTIHGFKRDQDGKNYSRKLRANGAIPGVLYGPDGKGNNERVLVAVPTSEVDRFRKRLNLSFESTLFYLDVDGEKTLVFPRQLSCHPGNVCNSKIMNSYRRRRELEFHSFRSN